MSKELEAELREIGIAIAGLELATWAAMRAIFETQPAAAAMARELLPTWLASLSGKDASDVKAKVELHIGRWLPK